MFKDNLYSYYDWLANDKNVLGLLLYNNTILLSYNYHYKTIKLNNKLAFWIINLNNELDRARSSSFS